MDANAVAQRAWDLRVNLMRVALSILHHSADAEDAVSTAMLKAYQSAESLSKEEKLNAWLMRILVLSCYDLLRKRKRETPMDDVSAYDTPILMHTENTVWECIRQLPASYQRVLVLFYYEGFKAREISRILSIPLGTVLVRLSRGRSKLKEYIIDEGVAYSDQQTI